MKWPSSVSFEKYQGTKNDFIIFNAAFLRVFRNLVDLGIFCRRLSDRYTGIGSDGILFVEKTETEASVLIVNSDGSIASQCLNALRCIGLKIQKAPLAIKSLSLRDYFPDEHNEPILIGTIDSFSSTQVTVKARKEIKIKDITKLVIDCALKDLTIKKATFVQMQNPHLIIERDIPTSKEFAKYYGRLLQAPNLLPIPTSNISFLSPGKNQQLDLIVFERGAGLTQSCGSATLASFAIAKGNYPSFMTDEGMRFHLLGGDIIVKEENNEYLLTAEAKKVCEGTLDNLHHFLLEPIDF